MSQTSCIFEINKKYQQDLSKLSKITLPNPAIHINNIFKLQKRVQIRIKNINLNRNPPKRNNQHQKQLNTHKQKPKNKNLQIKKNSHRVPLLNLQLKILIPSQMNSEIKNHENN